MTEDIKKMTIEEYIDNLGSSTNVMGAGTVSALTCRQAFALLSLLLAGRHKYLAHRAQVEEFTAVITTKQEQCGLIANQYCSSFEKVLELRNSSSFNVNEFREVLKDYYEVIFNCTELARDGIEIIEILMEGSVGSLEGDLEVAFLLFESAWRASFVNARKSLYHFMMVGGSLPKEWAKAHKTIRKTEEVIKKIKSDFKKYDNDYSLSTLWDRDALILSSYLVGETDTRNVLVEMGYSAHLSVLTSHPLMQCLSRYCYQCGCGEWVDTRSDQNHRDCAAAP